MPPKITDQEMSLIKKFGFKFCLKIQKKTNTLRSNQTVRSFHGYCSWKCDS